MPSLLRASEVGRAHARLCTTWMALSHDARLSLLDAFHYDDYLNPFVEEPAGA